MNSNHFFFNLITMIIHYFQIGTTYFIPHPNRNLHQLAFYYQNSYLLHSDFDLNLFR